MVTTIDFESVRPPLSVTVSVTTNDPTVVKVWLGEAPEPAGEPSPKSQE